MKIKQPEISLYSSKDFGELHATITSQGKVFYCASDLCRCLNLLIREGEKIIKASKCATKEYMVKKAKKDNQLHFRGLWRIVVIAHWKPKDKG